MPVVDSRTHVRHLLKCYAEARVSEVLADGRDDAATVAGRFRTMGKEIWDPAGRLATDAIKGENTRVEDRKT